MEQFTTDIKGRVNNTPLPEYKSLWPLFEAIVNSIQSLEDSVVAHEDGFIDVFAQRQESGEFDFDGRMEVMPFESFDVIDNGNGFMSESYRSFKTADSSFKWKKGCKGIGRFLWLKAFDEVKIESTFCENDEWKHRSFSFDFNGIDPSGEENLRSAEDKLARTTVSLIGFKHNFRSKAPKHLEVLAKKIIEHCLTYFLTDGCPKIVIRDSLGEQFHLNDYFNKNIRDSIHQDKFSVGGKDFTLYHLKMPEGARAHELHLCANKREVRSISLKKYLPNLQSRIMDETDSGFFYAGFLESPYLDAAVNNSRTDFEFEQYSQVDMDENLPEKELFEATKNYISGYLSEYLDEIEIKKQKRINDYVCHQQPKYRYLISERPGTLASIPPTLNDKDLEMALYKELLTWDLETKKTGEELQKDLTKNKLSPSDVKARYDQYYRQINALSKTSLAEYIVRRKVILDMLENALQKGDDGRYANEDIIHSIIFPMQYTSDEVSFEEMNLWVIDERLAYHNFLASDKQMRSMPVISSDSEKRIDIAIFDEAISFSDEEGQFNSITIIEFKKPNRDDFRADEKNPLRQVLRYVEEIKNGKKMRANGRPFGNVDNTAFHCYIIADLTPSLKEAARYATLRLTPDGEGYFGYIPDPGAYIEIISLDKLLRDANKRNQVLFDKLFTPSPQSILEHTVVASETNQT